MKTLSLLQPWATLVAIGAKLIETRSWATAYRGPLAIHASKGFDAEQRNLCLSRPFRQTLENGGVKFNFDIYDVSEPIKVDLPLGMVIATCRLIAVYQIIESGGKQGQAFVNARACAEGDRNVRFPSISAEYIFGDYSPARFMWVLADIVPLPKPAKARGSLGLWDWIEVEAVH